MLGPLLAIRADASLNGGTGHVMRTLAIAQEWIGRGGRVLYVSAILPFQLEDRLIGESCQMHRLANNGGSCEDASETSSLIAGLKPRWLLVDGYHLSARYQMALDIPACTQVACISDFGIDDVDKPKLVIHPNIVQTADYSGLSNDFIELAGPQYILLRKEIITKTVRKVAHTAKHLLVTMGGSDPREASAKICQQLISSGVIESLRLRVILGPAYPENGQVYGIIHPHIDLVSCPESMHEHYAWSDTAICSPSTTAFELAHCKLPIGLVMTADNQVKVLEAMQRAKAAVYLADMRVPSELENLTTLLTGVNRETMARRAANLVDGKGAARVCDVLQFPMIRFREANEGDTRDLWEWANDKDTREVSFHSEPIPWEDHLLWVKQQTESETSQLLIVESDEMKLGTMRFQINEEAEAIVSICLAPAARGLGLASLIIQQGVNYHFSNIESHSIVAWIKLENTASHKAFTRAQFVSESAKDYPDRIKMRFNRN